MIRKNDKFAVILLSFLVFILCAYDIYTRCTFISGDEYGYFAAASHFSGRNWVEATKNFTMYYSYGFSLLTAPLYNFFGSTVTVYKAALVLNSILAALIVPVSYWVISMFARGSAAARQRGSAA